MKRHNSFYKCVIIYISRLRVRNLAQKLEISRQIGFIKLIYENLQISFKNPRFWPKFGLSGLQNFDSKINYINFQMVRYKISIRSLEFVKIWEFSSKNGVKPEVRDSEWTIWRGLTPLSSVLWYPTLKLRINSRKKDEILSNFAIERAVLIHVSHERASQVDNPPPPDTLLGGLS